MIPLSALPTVRRSTTPTHSSALALLRRVSETAALSWRALACRTWHEVIDDDVLGRSLDPFVSPQVLDLIQEQMRRLANNESGGLLTFGVAGALRSSAALISNVGALNRACDIEEARPWWNVATDCCRASTSISTALSSGRRIRHASRIGTRARRRRRR